MLLIMIVSFISESYNIFYLVISLFLLLYSIYMYYGNFFNHNTWHMLFVVYFVVVVSFSLSLCCVLFSLFSLFSLSLSFIVPQEEKECCNLCSWCSIINCQTSTKFCTHCWCLDLTMGRYDQVFWQQQQQYA